MDFLNLLEQGPQLKQRAIRKYPIMGGYPYSVSSPYSRGEFYSKDEAYNPRFGEDHFEVPQDASPDYMLGEFAHLLAKRDPVYQMWADQFTQGMSPRFRAIEERIQKQDMGDDRPFDDYWDLSRREGHIRSYVLPQIFGGKERDNILRFYTPRQMDALKAINDYLKQQWWSREGRDT